MERRARGEESRGEEDGERGGEAGGMGRGGWQGRASHGIKLQGTGHDSMTMTYNIMPLHPQ